MKTGGGGKDGSQEEGKNQKVNIRWRLSKEVQEEKTKDKQVKENQRCQKE